MALGNVSPFVYWAQNDKKIFLRVDLNNVKAPDIELTGDSLGFSAYGVGARGEEKYSFSLNFYAPLDPDGCEYRVSDRHIEIQLSKQSAQWWPRILREEHKPAWLKLDFDKLQTEDEDSDGDRRRHLDRIYRDDSVDNIVNQMDTRSNRRHRRRAQEMRRVYLFLYNLFQFVGFLYIAIVLLIRYAKDGERSMEGTWDAAGKAMQVVILLQGLEVVHPLLGYTVGSFLHPLVLVGGRILIIFAMIKAEPRMQTKPVVFYLFAIYTLVELFRYPYYMLRTYNKSIGFMTWLRYTVWIPLLPLGFLCEGVIILRNIPYFEETHKLSISLPNAFNFSFHLPTFLRLYLLIGIFPVLAFMMSHMYRQRKKVIGPAKKED
uniref:Very-long-chain (3R)-3-hydroxyacyl-CoA dehydratase n=1 Tax=Ornithodoros turicata TaxID=34597 RepID=A0A2R5LAJ8_9ACAR